MMMRYYYLTLIFLVLSQCVGGGTGQRSDKMGHKLTAEQIGLVYDGTQYRIRESYKSSGEMVFSRSSNQPDSVLLAADGQYVRAVIVANNGANAFMAGGISGQSSNEKNPKRMSFSGEYRLLSTIDPSLNNQTQDVNINVNLDSGTVSGSSVNDAAGAFVSQFRGVIHSDDIEMHFLDQTGMHKGQGNLYGPNSDEFAAYYVDDTHGGMIYAKRN